MFLIPLVVALGASRSVAPDDPVAPQDAVPQAAATQAPVASEPGQDIAPESFDSFVPARSYSTQPETDPPRYVRNLARTGLPGTETYSWLDCGFDYRMRFEFRDDDLRRPVAGMDSPILLRGRAYAGIKEILDPFRFAVEFSDVRRYNSAFALDDRDVNQYEFIQAIAELYFAEALGPEQPLRLQAGRFAYEYLDRRLIARNEWRNTTNTFQGFRAILGQEKNDWRLDVFAWQPLERLLSRPDRPDEDTWFYGVIGNWRRWSQVITLQPYYLLLDQAGEDGRIDRAIHHLAVRGYGLVGKSGFDYDFDIGVQLGHHGDARHEAFGATTEIGYTFAHEWKPRVSMFFGYGSGDRDPDDDVNQRFERFYGFGRPWSANDYFRWENIVTPKARLELQPHAKLRIDTGYSAYWLASATDAWPTTKRQDPTGQSGSFVGHEIDIRFRWAATPRLDLTLGYAHFFSGRFVSDTGRGDDTDFVYVETTLRAFK